MHTSRTIMLLELETLLSRVADSSSEKAVYQLAIVDDNCLSKRTENTRKLTFQHLVELYGLSPDIILFRALLFFGKGLLTLSPFLPFSVPMLVIHYFELPPHICWH